MMLDEFASLGKLEIMQESLAFVAGYGIKCYIIIQDINQLQNRETGYGKDETITSACGIQNAFAPNRLRDRRASIKTHWADDNRKRADHDQRSENERTSWAMCPGHSGSPASTLDG